MQLKMEWVTLFYVYPTAFLLQLIPSEQNFLRAVGNTVPVITGLRITSTLSLSPSEENRPPEAWSPIQLSPFISTPLCEAGAP